MKLFESYFETIVARELLKNLPPPELERFKDVFFCGVRCTLGFLTKLDRDNATEEQFGAALNNMIREYNEYQESRGQEN
jgi:hypothetical protein